MSGTFNCGHPREEGNIALVGPRHKKQQVCRFCQRMRTKRLAIDAQIERWCNDQKTMGQQIMEKYGCAS